jgi:hypothetical protein
MLKIMLRNQENPLIRLIRVLTIWRIRGCKTRKHHRTGATVKVAPTLLWQPRHAGDVAIVGATFTVAPVQRGGALQGQGGALQATPLRGVRRCVFCGGVVA